MGLKKKLVLSRHTVRALGAISNQHEVRAVAAGMELFQSGLLECYPTKNCVDSKPPQCMPNETRKCADTGACTVDPSIPC